MTTKNKQQQWSKASSCLQEKLFVLQRAEPEKCPKPFGEDQKIVSGSQLVDITQLEFGFALFRFVLWFYPFEVGVIFFLFVLFCFIGAVSGDYGSFHYLNYSLTF